MDTMISLNEVTILPSSIYTEINSRSEVNPFIDNKLPIFVAPMTCILNAYNFGTFKESRVIPIRPRGVHDVPTFEKSDWRAVSLSEFEYEINNNDLNDSKILIDVANGHMPKLYALTRVAKTKFPRLTIMIGNIANPHTYTLCCDNGIDYVRVGIGGGNACKTSVLTGVHASLPYLLSEIKKIRSIIPGFQTKVIADGGIDRIDKAIKCLALGADYVMMGKTFAKTEEACGRFRTVQGKSEREYYGMASEQGQIDLSGTATHVPEGISTWVPIEYSLSKYCEYFEAGLRSAMSYVGAKDLTEFHEKAKIGVQSMAEFNSYNKPDSF